MSARKKPIILWKGGMSEQGARAAASHTGALAGSASIWNAMFKQTGIIDVTSVAEVVDCAVAFHNLPLPKGRRVAVIGGQGGTGVGTADNCYALGLELPALGEKTVARLREVLPPVGTSVGNPTDTGVASLLDPSLYEKAIEIVAADDGVDMILVISTPVPECLEPCRGGGQGDRQAAGRLRVRPARVGAGDLPLPQRAGRGGLPGPQTGRLRAGAHGRVRGLPRAAR